MADCLGRKGALHLEMNVKGIWKYYFNWVAPLSASSHPSVKPKILHFRRLQNPY